MKTVIEPESHLLIGELCDADRRLKIRATGALSDMDTTIVSSKGRFLYLEEHSGIHVNPPWEQRYLLLPKEA